MNVDPTRLQRGRVPMLCAKTGVPTTLLQRHRVPVFRRISLWWLLLFSLGLYVIVVLARTRFHRIELPISEPVRRRYNTLRALRLALGLGIVAVVVLADNWYYGVVPGAAWWWLHRRTQAAWVCPKGVGVFVRLTDAHYDFKEAVRAGNGVVSKPPAVLAPLEPSLLPPVAPPEPSPLPDPGWYPDPSGQYAIRYWDGTAWTEQVSGAA